jgi:N-methylhydantoinase A
MVDIHTVSAGGGSIAWIDDGRALRVGPRSAGATPGPACYARGGRQPTVTDANLLLGYLPSDEPIASGLRLDPAAAEAALGTLAREAGYDSPVDAAQGVVDVAVNELVQALRVVSVERGHDPSAATLIAFGGAGPLHACALAESLGATRVICLGASGVLSALGLASADRRSDRARTLLLRLDTLDANTLTQAAAEMAGATNGYEVRCIADLRYQGQSFEIMVPFSLGEAPATLAARFHAEHQRRYGHSGSAHPVELVTLRTAVVESGPPVTIADPRNSASTTVRKREIRISGCSHTASVYRGEALAPDMQLASPAIVEYEETTCVIPPDWRGHVDRHRILRLDYQA